MKKIVISTGLLVLLSTTTLFAGAVAGVEQEVHAGERVTLDGSESFTEKRGGKIVRFKWRQVRENYETPFVYLSKRRSIRPTFIAPEVEEATVLKFRLTTKEKFKNRRGKKRKFRSRDFVNVIVLPVEDVVVPPTEPVVPVKPIITPVDVNLDPVTHDGFTYIPVVSPTTGRVWLDRNVGASKSCIDGTLNECQGGRYQWGRETDGHEDVSTRVKVGDRATTLFGNGNKIFKNFDGDWTGFGVDFRGTIRKDFWSRTDGSSICPVNYRVANLKEFNDEIITKGIVANSLGFISGIYWSINNDSSLPTHPFRVKINALIAEDFERQNDFPVRCIKD